MVVELYHSEASGPCRAVRMVAKEAGVELKLISLNLREKEHLTPEFIKLNPQHQIPTLVDGDFSLGESRAIMAYLMNTYAPDSEVYPKCPKKRALVDRLLYFDAGTLHQRFVDYLYPQKDGSPADPAKAEKLKEALRFLGTFLRDKKYLISDTQYTLADLAIGATLTMIDIIDMDMECDNVKAYYERLKQLPYWEECNALGMQEYRERIAFHRKQLEAQKSA